MQETSEVYQRLLADPNHYIDNRLVVGEDGVLTTAAGEGITFGGVRILVETGAPDGGYDEGVLQSLETSGGLFSSDTPSVGNAVSRQVDIRMLKPAATFPRQARMAAYIRLNNGEEHSEWLPKGVFYIDTRKNNPGDVEWLDITGYDAMMRTEQEFTGAGLSWPATDITVVRNIAAAIGITLDTRTAEIMTSGYSMSFLTGYTMREWLAGIAAMYAGNFIINDSGQLRLVAFNGIPPETNCLCDSVGYDITFGGDRILV